MHIVLRRGNQDSLYEARTVLLVSIFPKRYQAKTTCAQLFPDLQYAIFMGNL